MQSQLLGFRERCSSNPALSGFLARMSSGDQAASGQQCFYCPLLLPDASSLALHYVRSHWREVRARQARLAGGGRGGRGALAVRGWSGGQLALLQGDTTRPLVAGGEAPSQVEEEDMRGFRLFLDIYCKEMSKIGTEMVREEVVGELRRRWEKMAVEEREGWTRRVE